MSLLKNITMTSKKLLGFLLETSENTLFLLYSKYSLEVKLLFLLESIALLKGHQ